MKRNILILLLMFCTLVSYAQKDTLVIIVDKNADYVLFKDNIPITKYDSDYSKKDRKDSFLK